MLLLAMSARAPRVGITNRDKVAEMDEAKNINCGATYSGDAKFSFCWRWFKYVITAMLNEGHLRIY